MPDALPTAYQSIQPAINMSTHASDALESPVAGAFPNPFDEPADDGVFQFPDVSIEDALSTPKGVSAPPIPFDESLQFVPQNENDSGDDDICFPSPTADPRKEDGASKKRKAEDEPDADAKKKSKSFGGSAPRKALDAKPSSKSASKHGSSAKIEPLKVSISGAKQEKPVKSDAKVESSAKKESKADPPAKKESKADPPAKKESKADPPAKKESKADPPAKKESKADPPAKKESKADPPAKKEPKADPPAKKEPKADPPAKKESKKAPKVESEDDPIESDSDAMEEDTAEEESSAPPSKPKAPRRPHSRGPAARPHRRLAVEIIESRMEVIEGRISRVTIQLERATRHLRAYKKEMEHRALEREADVQQSESD